MIRALAVVLVIGAATRVHADPEQEMFNLRNALQDAWGAVDGAWVIADADSHADFKPPRCQHFIDALASSPGTLKVRFDFATGDFPRGEHTLAEMRTSCDHVTRLARVKVVEAWAEQSMNDSPKLDGNDYELSFYRGCIEAYDGAVKAGMSPTEQVPERNLQDPKTHQPLVWKGTIEDIRKAWCDPGLAKAKAKIAAKEAPYRAVLKNDKLEMALEAPYFYMPGGHGTDKPKDLAASNVWFRDSTPDSGCVSGTPHVLTRHQFDATQKLVKTTSKTYCGTVPGSAYH